MKKSGKNWSLIRFIALIFLLGFVCTLSAFGVDKVTTKSKLTISQSVNHKQAISKKISKGLQIRLASGEFDPLMEPTPEKVTKGLFVQGYPEGQKGYYIVQFDGPIREGQKQALEQAGASIFDYIPDFAFLVKMDEITRATVEAMKKVRWVGVYQPAYRITPTLAKAMAAGEAISRQDFIVSVFKGEDVDAIARQIQQLGGNVLNIMENDFRAKMKVRLSPDKLDAVSSLGGVKWIEPAPVWKLFNDVAAGIMGVPSVWDTHTLYGSGQVVAVADSGLDQGSADPAQLHDDFEDGSGNSRVAQLFDLAGDGSAADNDGHGTHVAGSVLGNGIKSGSTPSNHAYDGSYAGTAPEATLVFQALADERQGDALTGIPVDLADLFQPAYDADARIHTNSWGSSGPGVYDSESSDVDGFVWDHKNFLILFAAGNEGVDANGDGVVDLHSVGSPATAKNCIAVGATENYRPHGSSPSPASDSNWGEAFLNTFSASPIDTDHMSNNENGMAAFSSRGPCLDGRFKPDIVAPGVNIISTRSSEAPLDPLDQGGLIGSDYTFMAGTSMATPLAAGAATLVRQFYTDVEGILPSAALIKATLLNGAADMSPGQYGTGATQEIPDPPRPNNVGGWGRVDLETSIFPASPKVLRYVDKTSSLETGESRIYALTVGDGGVPLKATLVWSDYPGSPVSGGGLVNDLDLILMDPDSNRHYPNNSIRRGQTVVIKYDPSDFYQKFKDISGPGVGYAVKFTPNAYPAVLDKALLYLRMTQRGQGVQFRCKVWDDDGPGGLPGTNLLSRDAFVNPNDNPPGEPDSGSWVTVDLSGVTITEGSFYIEYHATQNTQDSQIAFDSSGPDGRTYYFDGASWSLQQTYDIVIRAVVTTEDDSTNSDRVNNVVGIDIDNPATGSYLIRVEAYNVPQGPQPYALVVSGGDLSSLVELTPPAAPSDLSVSARSDTRILLAWTDNATDETSFKIERRVTGGGEFAEIASVGPDVTSYDDTTLSESTTYDYRVRAYNADGYSSYSNEDSDTTYPATPSDLSANSVSTSQIDLTWTDNSSGESGCFIERKEGSGGTYVVAGTVGANVTSYSDTGLKAATVYYYKVLVYNPAGSSAYSNEASAVTFGIYSGGGGGGG